MLDVDRLARELEDERVRAVTVSWVQFASGARVDLDALGALCRARGVYFVVDAIQGLGPLTIDLSTTHVDIFACGAQKWLLSPWGSGFVYVRHALIEQLEPHDVSWLAVRGADDFTPTHRLRPHLARRRARVRVHHAAVSGLWLG